MVNPFHGHHIHNAKSRPEPRRFFSLVVGFVVHFVVHFVDRIVDRFVDRFVDRMEYFSPNHGVHSPRPAHRPENLVFHHRVPSRRRRGLETPRQFHTRSHQRLSLEYLSQIDPSIMRLNPRERDEQTPGQSVERPSLPPLNLDDGFDDSAALDSGWTDRIVRLEALVGELRSENSSIRVQLEELHQPPASSSEAARSSVGDRSEAARSSVGDRSLDIGNRTWTDRIVRLEEVFEGLLAEQLAMRRRIESLTPIVIAAPAVPTPAPNAPRSDEPPRKKQRAAKESVGTLQEARTAMRNETPAVLLRSDSAEERLELERLFGFKKPLSFKRAFAVHLFGDKNVYLENVPKNLQESYYIPTATERRMLLQAIALHAEIHDLPSISDSTMWQQMSRALSLNRKSRQL